MSTKSPRKAATSSASTASTAKKARPTDTAKVAVKRAVKMSATPSPVPQTETPAPAADARPQRGKLAQIIALLERDEGATLIDLMAATGWQPHSVRGALSTLKKKRGQPLQSIAGSDGLRQYRLEAK